MSLKLFMVLLGCKPEGRHTEQHDIFFGVGENIGSLIPEMNAFWPEAKGRMHVDAWREVGEVDGYTVSVEKRENKGRTAEAGTPHLYFINLGGYKQDMFEEFHYKMVVAAPDKGAAIKAAKATAFFQHTGFEGANSHVDDKYGVDIDDINEIEDILPATTRERYQLVLRSEIATKPDPIYLGYFKFEKLVAGG